MVAVQGWPETQSTLCEWAASLQWGSLPRPVQMRAAERLLDTIGLALVGSRTEAAQAAIAASQALRSGSRSPAAGPIPCDQLALLLGTMAHCRDFDDTFPKSLAHPGSVVLPALLGLASTHDAGDEDFAAAIVVGYELAARLSGLANSAMLDRGFHATGVIGAVAAAASASRLLKLDASRMSGAIGLSCSMAGGLMAFLADGSWSKWLHAGWAAHAGVHAALLAGAGFRGPASGLLGKNGLLQAYMGLEDSAGHEILVDDLGRAWHEEQATTKQYPCAHVIQPYIDAAIALKREHRLSADDVAEITCDLPGWAVDVVALPHERKLQVQTEMDAIASLYYMVACGFLDEAVTVASLGAAHRQRSDIRQLAQKVSWRVDDDLGRSLRGPVAILTRDGQLHRLTVPLRTPDRALIRKKFLENVAAALEHSPGIEKALRAPPARTSQDSASAERFADDVLNAAVPSWRSSLDFLAFHLPAGTLIESSLHE